MMNVTEKIVELRQRLAACGGFEVRAPSGNRAGQLAAVAVDEAEPELAAKFPALLAGLYNDLAEIDTELNRLKPRAAPTEAIPEPREAIVSVDMGGIVERAARAGMSASVSISLFPRDEPAAESLAGVAAASPAHPYYRVQEFPAGTIVDNQDMETFDYIIVGGVVVKNRHGPVHVSVKAAEPMAMQAGEEGPGQRRERLARERDVLVSDLEQIQRLANLIGRPLPIGIRSLAKMGEDRAMALSKDMSERITVVSALLIYEIESISAELDG